MAALEKSLAATKKSKEEAGPHKRLVAAVLPWMEPMLAVLSEEKFSSPEGDYFTNRLKYIDGERILAYCNGSKTCVSIRATHLTADWTISEILPILQRQKARSFIIDGEVVAFKPGERSSVPLRGSSSGCTIIIPILEADKSRSHHVLCV